MLVKSNILIVYSHCVFFSSFCALTHKQYKQLKAKHLDCLKFEGDNLTLIKPDSKTQIKLGFLD